MRNHTATHLLHAALRERLGTHVRQAGSYVGPGQAALRLHARRARSRADELAAVEEHVNGWIVENHPVRAVETTTRRGRGARRDGAVRREVRRHACAWSRSTEVLARALRRHARRPTGEIGALPPDRTRPRAPRTCAASRRSPGPAASSCSGRARASCARSPRCCACPRRTSRRAVEKLQAQLQGRCQGARARTTATLADALVARRRRASAGVRVVVEAVDGARREGAARAAPDRVRRSSATPRSCSAPPSTGACTWWPTSRPPRSSAALKAGDVVKRGRRGRRRRRRRPRHHGAGRRPRPREAARGARRGARWRSSARSDEPRSLALDHGEARCGCAVSDPTGTLATPLAVVERPDTRSGLGARSPSWSREQRGGARRGGAAADARGRRGRAGAGGARVRRTAGAGSSTCRSSCTTSASRRAWPSARAATSTPTRAPPRTCSRASSMSERQRTPRSEDERERARQEREALAATRQRRPRGRGSSAPHARERRRSGARANEPHGRAGPPTAARRRDAARARRPPRRPRALLHAALIVGVVARSLVFVAWFLVSLFQPGKGEGSGQVAVTIPAARSLGEIADILDSRGVVVEARSSSSCAPGWPATASDLKPGATSLKQDMSYSDVLDKLTQGLPPNIVNVTIPEGRSRSEIAPLVKQAGLERQLRRARAARSRASEPAPLRGAARREPRGLPVPGDLRAEARRQRAGTWSRKQLDAFKQNFANVDMSLRAQEEPHAATTWSRSPRWSSARPRSPRERPLIAVGDLQPAQAGHAAGHRRDDPLRDPQLDAAAAGVRSCSVDSPYNTRTAPGPAAGADRQPGPRIDQGGRPPGAHELPLLRGQAVR